MANEGVGGLVQGLGASGEYYVGGVSQNIAPAQQVQPASVVQPGSSVTIRYDPITGNPIAYNPREGNVIPAGLAEKPAWKVAEEVAIAKTLEGISGTDVAFIDTSKFSTTGQIEITKLNAEVIAQKAYTANILATKGSLNVPTKPEGGVWNPVIYGWDVPTKPVTIVYSPETGEPIPYVVSSGIVPAGLVEKPEWKVQQEQQAYAQQTKDLLAQGYIPGIQTITITPGGPGDIISPAQIAKETAVFKSDILIAPSPIEISKVETTVSQASMIPDITAPLLQGGQQTALSPIIGGPGGKSELNVPFSEPVTVISGITSPWSYIAPAVGGLVTGKWFSESGRKEIAEEMNIQTKGFTEQAFIAKTTEKEMEFAKSAAISAGISYAPLTASLLSIPPLVTKVATIGFEGYFIKEAIEKPTLGNIGMAAILPLTLGVSKSTEMIKGVYEKAQGYAPKEDLIELGIGKSGKAEAVRIGETFTIEGQKVTASNLFTPEGVKSPTEFITLESATGKAGKPMVILEGKEVPTDILKVTKAGEDYVKIDTTGKIGITETPFVDTFQKSYYDISGQSLGRDIVKVGGEAGKIEVRSYKEALEPTLDVIAQKPLETIGVEQFSVIKTGEGGIEPVMTTGRPSLSEVRGASAGRLIEFDESLGMVKMRAETYKDIFGKEQIAVSDEAFQNIISKHPEAVIRIEKSGGIEVMTKGGQKYMYDIGKQADVIFKQLRGGGIEGDLTKITSGTTRFVEFEKQKQGFEIFKTDKDLATGKGFKAMGDLVKDIYGEKIGGVKPTTIKEIRGIEGGLISLGNMGTSTLTAGTFKSMEIGGIGKSETRTGFVRTEMTTQPMGKNTFTLIGETMDIGRTTVSPSLSYGIGVSPQESLSIQPRTEERTSTNIITSLITGVMPITSIEPRIDTRLEPRIETRLEPRIETRLETRLQIEPRLKMMPSFQPYYTTRMPVPNFNLGFGGFEGGKRRKKRYGKVGKKGSTRYLPTADLPNIEYAFSKFGKVAFGRGPQVEKAYSQTGVFGMFPTAPQMKMRKGRLIL